ncbi:MAG: Hsp20/alpha crystallin family protein [Melioribacteraceae bacterium]|nr:Hsp20/alpha crystallin family protein [Melioribacteraceae bacterium]MCF8265479.1 Hsp20/alpha crystallin family protein [Melioribacteraceae bacterium]MCF8412734.1 Hsp20/alpha crystallin family protein [Melioribacteraceae bacterium]MCF8431102.1 Hsp20/alpha crystallin family protein [Melioribacteraceae bacterium]
MTLVRFEPFNEMERFANRFFNDLPLAGLNFNDSFRPTIDISEDKKNIIVEVEAPGLTKKDLKITLKDNILTIEGEKKREEEKKDQNFYRSERVYGSFKRSFTLPVEVNSDKVDAKFEDGILNIRIAKLEEKPKNEKVIELK